MKFNGWCLYKDRKVWTQMHTRGDGPGTTEADAGVMQLKARHTEGRWQSGQKLDEAGRRLPESHPRPSDTLTSDFRPAGLRKEQRASL